MHIAVEDDKVERRMIFHHGKNRVQPGLRVSRRLFLLMGIGQNQNNSHPFALNEVKKQGEIRQFGRGWLGPLKSEDWIDMTKRKRKIGILISRAQLKRERVYTHSPDRIELLRSEE